MPVDPTGDDLKRYLDEDPGGEVVMLNILRFKEDGGLASYGEYGEKVGPFLEAAGGSVVWAGNCSTALVSPGGWDWDMLLLVRYPSREAFIRMVSDPEYQKITGLRTQALDEAVLQALAPWSP